VELRTTFSDGTLSHAINIRYIVVTIVSTYNLLLGRPSLKARRGGLDEAHEDEIALP